MTDIRIISQNRPARARNAVVLCCDAKYLPYAALTIHTLLRHAPQRDFDICITSLDALDMPPALAADDIRLCQIDVGTAFDAMPVTGRLSVATYMRLALPDAFAADYDRMLYIDSDVFIVGIAIADVFALDLGGRVLGACLDNAKLKHPRKMTKDQALLSINGPYFNAGVLLFDVNIYRENKVLNDCISAAQRKPDALLQLDQTLLNIALRDQWAELHPAWNWQWSVVRPLFAPLLDVQIVHFITTVKPWADPAGLLPIGYRQIARKFLAEHYPDLPIAIAPPAPRLRRRDLLRDLLKHITRAPTFLRHLNRHGGDIRRVVRPMGDR